MLRLCWTDASVLSRSKRSMVSKQLIEIYIFLLLFPGLCLQSENRFNRTQRRARKIRLRLSFELDTELPLPGRPKPCIRDL